MRFIMLSLAVTSMLLLGGCFSMEVASNEALRNSCHDTQADKPVEHVMVSNYGWYLFNCIPLVCGDTNPDATLPWIFFSDQVDPILLHDKLMKYTNSKGANMTDLVFNRYEEVFFDVPGSDIPFPLPYLVCYREIQFSGVLTKHIAQKNADGKDGLK